MKMSQMLVLIILSVIPLAFAASACYNAPNPHQNEAPEKSDQILKSKDLEKSEQVFNGIRDNNKSSVYIKVANPLILKNQDYAVMEIIEKKEEWQKKFPEKKLIAMSIVTGDMGSNGHPVVFGLLIHYEKSE